MEFIDAFKPSLVSLLIINLVPFSYFGYHSSKWYDIPRLKRFDFFLMALSLILGAVWCVKIIREWQFLEQDRLLLLFLHGIPLALTALIVRGNKLGTQLDKIAAKERQKDSYDPKPMNKKVDVVSWNELIIDEDLKSELLSVVDLLKDPATSQKYGIEVPKGILLAGPPGTGKTTIARVIASNAGLHFFTLSMNDVVSQWVGETEKNLSKLFAAAQRYAPSVIFMDEIDSIGRARSSGGQQWSENVLNHLLQLMDGITGSKGLYIIGATNRPDLVDNALKRPGRLNKVIEIPLPDYQSRARLFDLYLRKLPLAENFDSASLASATEGLSAADIAAICNQAGLNAYKREAGSNQRDYKVSNEDLLRAANEFINQKRHELIVQY